MKISKKEMEDAIKNVIFTLVETTDRNQYVTYEAIEAMLQGYEFDGCGDVDEDELTATISETLEKTINSMVKGKTLDEITVITDSTWYSSYRLAS